MIDDLKPCPFCGGANLRTGGDDKTVGVWCLDCEAVGPNHYVTGQDWNNRADRIEELEAESERLRLALEETVSLLWDDMSKQESVGKHGGYIYMKCRAALAELTGGKDG